MASVRSIITKNQSWICYIGIFLITFVTLEGTFRLNLFNIALDEFKANLLISTFGAVTDLLGILLALLCSKLSDYFGRSEIFLTTLLCYLLSVILIISANSLSSFATGYFISTIGLTGYEIIKMIILAGLTWLPSRGILSSIDLIPTGTNSWICTFFATPISVSLGQR